MVGGILGCVRVAWGSAELVDDISVNSQNFSGISCVRISIPYPKFSLFSYYVNGLGRQTSYKPVVASGGHNYIVLSKI